MNSSIVAVTGATGFVGSHIVDILLEKGYTVRCLARSTSNMRWLAGKNVEIVDASLSSVESLKNAFTGVDYVIHSAGLTAARNEDEFMRGNKGGTENVFEAIQAVAPNIKKVVHISSLAAVGPARSKSTPITEQTSCEPITAYGRSKYQAERVALSYTSSLPITIIRPPAVYGDRDEAVFTFFQTVNKGIKPLIGFSEKWVSLIHVVDLARGIVRAMESENTTGKTYFVSSEEFYTWNQISTITATILGKSPMTLKIPHTIVMAIAGISEFFGKFLKNPPVLNYEKGMDIIQNYWVCSVDAAKRDFGYTQQISLEQGILRTITWYKEQGWLK